MAAEFLVADTAHTTAGWLEIVDVIVSARPGEDAGRQPFGMVGVPHVKARWRPA